MKGLPRLPASPEKEPKPPQKLKKGPSDWELGVGDSIRILVGNLRLKGLPSLFCDVEPVK
jgi:hypothetical protein